MSNEQTNLTDRAARDLAAFRAIMDRHNVHSVQELADSVDGEEVLDAAAREGIVTLGNFDATQDREPVIITQGDALMWAITIDGRHHVIGEDGHVEEWE